MQVYKVLTVDWKTGLPFSLVPFGQLYEPGVWYDASCGLPQCPGRPAPLHEHFGFHPRGYCGFWSFVEREQFTQFLLFGSLSANRALYTAEVERHIALEVSSGRTVVRSGRIKIGRMVAWGVADASCYAARPGREDLPS